MRTIYEDSDVQRETEKLDNLKRQAADLRSQLETLRKTPVNERLQTQADRLLNNQEIVFEDRDIERRLQVTELAVRTQETRLFTAKQSAGRKLWTAVEPEGNRLRNDTLSALQNLRECLTKERRFFDSELPSIGLTDDLHCIRSSGPNRELCNVCGAIDDSAAQQASPLGRWMSWYRGDIGG